MYVVLELIFGAHLKYELTNPKRKLINTSTHTFQFTNASNNKKKLSKSQEDRHRDMIIFLLTCNVLQTALIATIQTLLDWRKILTYIG